MSGEVIHPINVKYRLSVDETFSAKFKMILAMFCF